MVAALPLLPGLRAADWDRLAVSGVPVWTAAAGALDRTRPAFGMLFVALLVVVGHAGHRVGHHRVGHKAGHNLRRRRRRAEPSGRGRRRSRWTAAVPVVVAVPVLVASSVWSVSTLTTMSDGPESAASGSVGSAPTGSGSAGSAVDLAAGEQPPRGLDSGTARAVAAVTRAAEPGTRVLVLRRPPPSAVLRYTLAAGEGPRFPDIAVPDRLLPGGRELPSSPASDALAAAVADLAAGAPGAARQLARFAVVAVVVPAAAADPGLVMALDAVDDLARERVHPEVLVWRPLTAGLSARAQVINQGIDQGGEQGVEGDVSGAADGGVDDTGSGAASATATSSQPLPGFTVTRSGLVGETELPMGRASRRLVLAEPAAAGWRATLDGRELPRATAWGWAQAFELPADGGRLRVSYEHGPHRRTTAACAGALALVVALGPLAARGRRRRPTVGSGVGSGVGSAVEGVR